MIAFFISSGLFLGWSLGASDAANIFGSAVGSRMITFRKAAIIASIFVILGAVLQGSGTSDTLGRLGAVNATGGSFTVALAAAITIYLRAKSSIPVSTTQAIVGAIIGWNLYTGNPTDIAVLIQILITWITSPLLGAIFAVGLYLLLRWYKRRARIHMIRFESYIRTGLIITGAFGAFSLGSNNIANVMGVFVPSVVLPDITLGIVTIGAKQQLFFLGGAAIALGILTYSKRVMETIGSGILEMSSEAALVIVLSLSLVLFLFSSVALSDLMIRLGLPSIPLVPISSSQVVVGAILGLGIYKGARNLNFRMVRDIVIGRVSTPIVAGLIAFLALFFVENVFKIAVTQ